MPIRMTLETVLMHADCSGRELARRAGCHKDTIGKYRHNRVRVVSLDLLEKLCAALGCHLHDLLTDLHLSSSGPLRLDLRLPLPDGTRCPKIAAQMSDADLEHWFAVWYDAWDDARKGQ